MSQASPYGVRFQENGHVEVFPAAELSVLGPGREGIRALFHIDSGATTSVLPADDAVLLGIELEQGARMAVRGIGEVRFSGYRHMVKIQIGTHTLKAPVIFIEESRVPRILGREGVFSRFGILFDEAKHRTIFLDVRRQRKTIDALIA